MTSAILDHLWQSTLLALGLGLLAAAAFRKAAAGVRYGLWLAASLKFLVPFAALAALGRLLAPAGFTPAGATPEVAHLAQAARPLAQFPFAHAAALDAPPSLAPLVQTPLIHAPAAGPALHLDLGPILLAVWAFGCGAVVMAWAVRWARLRKVVRQARPIAWPAPMPVLASSSLMEPGLIGFLRPVLVTPETLFERLTLSEIDAVMAHEACHMRRRDNLTAAMHMVVEALFWFHPLVWWIGGRLIAERERACDEAVVEAGHDRAAYARSLVESCRLYLQSPLSCVAGASGSDLRTRVEMIMTAPPSSPLDPLKKAVLLAAGGCAFATPVAAGLLASPQGQTAVARASAVASRALGVSPAAPAPANDAARPIVLARNEAVVAPALALARLDAAPRWLTAELSAPSDLASAQAAAPQSAAPPPVQVAVAAPPQARPAAAAPAPQPLDITEAKQQAAEFVQSYGAFTTGPFARSHQTGRWASALCVQVAGVPMEEQEAVKARIEEVAKQVDVTMGDDEACPHPHVQIVFAVDAQAQLDNLVKQDSRILGDRTSPTRNVRTVTQPIQAWYVTNGVAFAQNDRNDPGPKQWSELKANVVWQRGDPNAGGGYGIDGGYVGGAYVTPGSSFGQNAGESGGVGSTWYGFPGPMGDANAARYGGARLFLNVLVIVDLKRAEAKTKSLGLLADYATMLALSQPRALGQCNVLPSITDLFASCPGRPAPTGLTAADAAYLTALYPQKGKGAQYGDESRIAERMANILAGAKSVASR